MLEDAANYAVKMLVYVKRRVGTFKQTLGGTSPHNVKDGGVMPLRTVLERIMDDDKLTDKLWRAEMREVELWENERFVRMFICPPSS